MDEQPNPTWFHRVNDWLTNGPPFGWNPRRTKSFTEQLNACVTICSTVVFVIALLYVIFVSIVPPMVPCYTPSCLKAANLVLENVDDSVDSCTDFRKYACGRYANKMCGRWRQSRVQNHNQYIQDTFKRLLLESRPDEASLPSGFRAQRKFYRACMNTSAIEEDRDRTFLEALRYVTGWPSRLNTMDNASWFDVVRKARERGFSSHLFLSFNVVPQLDTVTLKLEPPQIQLKSLYKAKSTNKTIEMVEALAGVWIDATSEFGEVRKFIEDLSVLIMAVRRYQSSTWIIKVHELSTFLQEPRLDWIKFLNQIIGMKPLDQVLYDNSVDHYLQGLHRLLKVYPKTIWIKYAVITFLLEDCSFLSEKIRNICHKIIGETRSRNDLCLKKAKDMYDNMLVVQFLWKTVTQKHRDLLYETFYLMKDQIDSNWIANATRPYLRGLLTNMTMIIGAPDYYYNFTWLEDAYKYTVIDTNGTLNVISLIHQANIDGFRRFSNFFEKPSTYFATVKKLKEYAGAYYSYTANEILLLGPVLVLPLYDPDRPEYLNYATLGPFLGHEITHMFAIGNDRLWTNETKQLFEAKLNCIADAQVRYASDLGYSLSNSENANTESVADFGGIDLAYRTYQAWVSKRGAEPNLIGVPYRANQIFWIMTTLFLCEYPDKANPLSPLATNKFVLGTRYPFPDFRISAPLMHSPYFARDFDCPPNSRMNPKDKCIVYDSP